MTLSQDWNKFLVSEQELARSYELVNELKRSWMKKHIAYLFSFYGHDYMIERVRSATQRAGFTHEMISAPVSRAAVFFYGHSKAWNRLLAAVIPAAAAGVDEIYVFLTGGIEQYCPEVLTALELAGIENTFLIDQAQAGSVFRTICSEPGTALMNLCSNTLAQTDSVDFPSIILKYIPLSFQGKPRGLIWASENSCWDYDTIKWAHADVEFTVGGPLAPKAPPGFKAVMSEGERLLQGPYDLFLGIRNLFRPGVSPRGFSQGMEPFWIWPEIDQSFFKTNRVYWKETV